MIYKKNKQMGYGAAISYMLVIGNALFGIFITPFVLKYLGSSSYGVYKTIASLSSSLLILDLGIGGTLIRYISKYRANEEDAKISSFVSMMLCECLLIIPIIVLIECILYLNLDRFYSLNFSIDELILAKQLFIILSANIVLNILEHFLNGIISGCNDFVFSKGIKLFSLIGRILLIMLLIPITKSATFLVSINLLLSALTVVFEVIYIWKNYHIRLTIDVKNWEWGLFKESFIYTLLIFLTTIAAQVNNNLDNVIIGAYCGPTQVTIYSFGLLIFSMFEQLSTSISGVALPTISKIIVENDWKQKIQEFIVKVGRIQFMLLGSATIGFIAIGREFLLLWLGAGFEDVYWIVLILIIPALFELCVNICLSVLRAKNMLTFRTLILIGSTVLNFVVSISMINILGYYSAALGTALSFTIGSLIIMNIYYCKKLHFNMIRIYINILDRTLPCLLISGIVIIICSHVMIGTWLTFFLKVCIFIVVFLILMLAWGFTNEERQIVKKILKKC